MASTKLSGERESRDLLPALSGTILEGSKLDLQKTDTSCVKQLFKLPLVFSLVFCIEFFMLPSASEQSNMHDEFVSVFSFVCCM